MTHDDVFARLAAADPLPDDALITDEDLALLAELVAAARNAGDVAESTSARTAIPRAAGPMRPRWSLQPALAIATAAAVTVAAVGVAVLLAPDRSAAPTGEAPTDSSIVSEAPVPAPFTTPPPTTPADPTTTPPIADVVAGLSWELQPLADALDTNVHGLGVYVSEPFVDGRLNGGTVWPADLPKPNYECGWGWDEGVLLESPDLLVAMCDIGDWSPVRVRTWVFDEGVWGERPTDPGLYSGWINGDGEGNFGAAIDIGVGFMANGTDDFLWASEDGLTWVPIPDTADVFPNGSITRAIGTSNGLVYIVGELHWPPEDVDGQMIDRLVVWIAELPPIGGDS